MDNDQLDKRFRTLAWGVFFILIGSLGVVPGDQTGWAILGGGIILLGLNLARSISRLPVNESSLVLGVLSLFLGALSWFRSAMGLHFNIELFPLMLIALGVYLLIPVFRRMETG